MSKSPLPNNAANANNATGEGALDRNFYRIGQVADLVGVEPHVLRYWESEVRELRPLKTRGSHRMYSRQDVRIAQQLKAWVDEGYTLSGARKKLRSSGVTHTGAGNVQVSHAQPVVVGHPRGQPPLSGEVPRSLAQRSLLEARAELQRFLLTDLNQDDMEGEQGTGGDEATAPIQIRVSARRGRAQR